MRDNLAVAIWLAFLSAATALMAVGLVANTITVHTDAEGFVTWHKVFYDAAIPAAPSTPAPAAPVVHITDDPGGRVADYYRKYQALNAAGAEVHFHGLCMSACTMILFKEFKDIRACADEGTTFGFHKPFGTSPDGTILRSKAEVKASRIIWKMWLASLPDGLHRYLQRSHVPSVYEGAEQNTLLLIPGKYLMPKCPVAEASL